MKKKNKVLIPLIPVLLLGIAGTSLSTLAWFEATRNIVAGDSDKGADVRPSAIEINDLKIYLTVDETPGSGTTLEPIELTDYYGNTWTIVEIDGKCYYRSVPSEHELGVTYGALKLQAYATKVVNGVEVPAEPIDVEEYIETEYKFYIFGNERTRLSLSQNYDVYSPEAQYATIPVTVRIENIDDDRINFTIESENMEDNNVYYSVSGGEVDPIEGQECPEEYIDESDGRGIGHVYISGEKRTTFYGEYPQTVVEDSELCDRIRESEITDENGYIVLEDGTKYVELFAERDFIANSGTYIYAGEQHFYKVEPIKWTILSDDGSEQFLASNSILEVQRYNEAWEGRLEKEDYQGNFGNVYCNNYKFSEIRSWLNVDFLNKAFNDQSKIKTTLVDNSVDSTCDKNNIYVCEDTEDKIFLLSRKELSTYQYGFSPNLLSYNTRNCNASDYALAKGVTFGESEEYLNNGNYWTRSPHFENYDINWQIRFDGDGGSEANYVDNRDDSMITGVRPAMRLAI